jgi:hypothetical protein
LFAGGLYVIDMKLMPWGCGVWPACESGRAEFKPAVSAGALTTVWTLGYYDAWPYVVCNAFVAT